MIQKINVPISVSLVFDHKRRRVYPKYVLWEGKVYLVSKVGLHHSYKLGSNLFHVFSVETVDLSFRLVLDSQTLHWTLEEISDGEAN